MRPTVSFDAPHARPMTAPAPTAPPAPPLSRPARVLFVGGHGHHYLARLLDADPAPVEAAVLVDPYDPPAAEAWAARHGVGRVYRSWDDAADFGAEAASVGVVYARNGAASAEALRRGYRVVTDKPLATTAAALAEVESAVAEVARGGGTPVVLTEFDLRCDRAFRAAGRAVASGRVGAPRLATAQKSYVLGDRRPAFYADAALAGGIVPWVLCHAVDAIRLAVGAAAGPADLAPVAGVRGGPASAACRGVESHAAALLRFGDDGVGVAHADYLRPAGAGGHGDDRLRVAGDGGVVEVRGGRCMLSRGGGPPVDVTADGEGPGVAEALLDALDRPGPDRTYHTADSLALARLMLAVAAATAGPADR